MSITSSAPKMPQGTGVYFVDAWYDNTVIATNDKFTDIMSYLMSGAMIVLRLNRGDKLEVCPLSIFGLGCFTFNTSDAPVIIGPTGIREDK